MSAVEPTRECAMKLEVVNPVGGLDAFIRNPENSWNNVARVFHTEHGQNRVNAKELAEEMVKRYNLHDELIEAASGVVENAEPNPADPAPHPAMTFLVPARNIEILKEILAKAGVS